MSPFRHIDFFFDFFFRAPRRAGGSGDPQGPTPNAGEGGKVAGDASEGARAAARWSIAARADRAAAPAWPVDDPALQTAVARSPGVGATRGARFDAKKKIRKKKIEKKTSIGRPIDRPKSSF